MKTHHIWPIFFISTLAFSLSIVLWGATTKIFTMADVTQHNTPKDCWMVITGKVYDVSSYIFQHPAPQQPLQDSCGKDATEGWQTKGKKNKPHSIRAEKLLKSFYIGDLSQSENR